MPTETGRHRLYEKIKQEWGEDHATELMSHLPPVGWTDVATKQDLELLSAELRAEMHAGFDRQSRWMVGAMVGLTAIFSAVVGLFTFLG